MEVVSAAEKSSAENAKQAVQALQVQRKKILNVKFILNIEMHFGTLALSYYTLYSISYISIFGLVEIFKNLSCDDVKNMSFSILSS